MRSEDSISQEIPNLRDESSSIDNSHTHQTEFSCQNNESEDNTEIISFMKIQGDPHMKQAIEEGHFELKCGHKIDLMTAGCRVSDKDMPVFDGYVGQLKVKVLRDTGCSGVVVRRELVPKRALTGEFKTCILIDGTIRRVPVAEIEIDTPLFVGKVSALCMQKPVFDLVLGNVEGVSRRVSRIFSRVGF
ncbi:hypothetical protein HOLleu_09479 [Holothuria leucospilota]|uniref:Uncharacterized protein n=1 Tax=Holothuria leucospilota TaxID=206669 RepID=A0A9Q1CDS0_HOLLE|nr:hypothetical protein HOLleu_09479 [Holothuria leucospilota]